MIDNLNKGFFTYHQFQTAFKDKVELQILKLFTKASRKTKAVDIQTLQVLINSMKVTKLIDLEKTLMSKYNVTAEVNETQFVEVMYEEVT